MKGTMQIGIIFSAILFVAAVILLVIVPGEPDLKIRLIQALATLLVPIGVVIAGKLIKDSLREREVDLQWVRTALTILQGDEIEGDAGLRKWGVEVVESYSGIRFDDQSRRALIGGELNMPTYIMPKNLRESAESYAFEDAVRGRFNTAVQHLPIRDVDTSVHSRGVSVTLQPHGPGGPADFTGQGTVVSAPVDWSRRNDPALVDEVVQVLVQQAEYEFTRQGWLEAAAPSADEADD